MYMEKINILNIIKPVIMTVLLVYFLYFFYVLFTKSCNYMKLDPQNLPWCAFNPSCEKICGYNTEICPVSCWHYENKVINKINLSILKLIN